MERSYSYDARFVTKHAAEQAQSRNVSMEEIVAVVSSPDLKSESQTERAHRKLYWKHHEGRLLVVVVGTRAPAQVVSVYPADKPKQRAFARMMAQA